MLSLLDDFFSPCASADLSRDLFLRAPWGGNGWGDDGGGGGGGGGGGDACPPSQSARCTSCCSCLFIYFCWCRRCCCACCARAVLTRRVRWRWHRTIFWFSASRALRLLSRPMLRCARLSPRRRVKPPDQVGELLSGSERALWYRHRSAAALVCVQCFGLRKQRFFFLSTWRRRRRRRRRRRSYSCCPHALLDLAFVSLFVAWAAPLRICVTLTEGGESSILCVRARVCLSLSIFIYVYSVSGVLHRRPSSSFVSLLDHTIAAAAANWDRSRLRLRWRLQRLEHHCCCRRRRHHRRRLRRSPRRSMRRSAARQTPRCPRGAVGNSRLLGRRRAGEKKRKKERKKERKRGQAQNGG